MLLILTEACKNEAVYDYTFKTVTEKSGAKSWIFTGSHKPRLDINFQFVNDVNTVLNKIGLPKIDHSVREKEQITHSRLDRGIFEWKNYPLGTLTIHRSMDKNSNYEDYDCIWKVTLSESKK